MQQARYVVSAHAPGHPGALRNTFYSDATDPAAALVDGQHQLVQWLAQMSISGVNVARQEDYLVKFEGRYAGHGKPVDRSEVKKFYDELAKARPTTEQG